MPTGNPWQSYVRAVVKKLRHQMYWFVPENQRVQAVELDGSALSSAPVDGVPPLFAVEKLPVGVPGRAGA
jgi:hypothetical protein